jgi:hypothetical protein
MRMLAISTRFSRRPAIGTTPGRDIHVYLLYYVFNGPGNRCRAFHLFSYQMLKEIYFVETNFRTT